MVLQARVWSRSVRGECTAGRRRGPGLKPPGAVEEPEQEGASGEVRGAPGEYLVIEAKGSSGLKTGIGGAPVERC